MSLREPLETKAEPVAAKMEKYLGKKQVVHWDKQQAMTRKIEDKQLWLASISYVDTAG